LVPVPKPRSRGTPRTHGRHTPSPERLARLQALAPKLSQVEIAVEIFKALGDPTRLRILHLLSQGELCVCNLAAALTMNPSAISHQLRLLRTQRLIRARRDGRRIFYALDDDHIERLLAEGFKHASHR